MSPPQIPNETAADDSTHKGGKKGAQKVVIEKKRGEIRGKRRKGQTAKRKRRIPAPASLSPIYLFTFSLFPFFLEVLQFSL